jgi:hypothetical protein
MQNSVIGIFVRCIGIARASIAVALMNLAYNFSRVEVLIRKKCLTLTGSVHSKTAPWHERQGICPRTGH